MLACGSRASSAMPCRSRSTASTAAAARSGRSAREPCAWRRRWRGACSRSTTQRCSSVSAATVSAVTIAELELDLEVFSGPFDLLLTLVLREEVDLMEVELADVVLAYLDFLEAKGELDLEVATEFLVLIAALLELKSRLMLPREDEELLDLELGQGEAAEELLQRLLEAQRYRRASEHLAARLEGEEGVRYRSAPLPAALRRVDERTLGAVYAPATLGKALGGLLRMPAKL